MQCSHFLHHVMQCSHFTHQVILLVPLALVPLLDAQVIMRLVLGPQG